MPFHETFWLAAAAAAPVITLATVVVVPDAAGIRFRAARREQDLRDLAVRAAPATADGRQSVPVAKPGEAGTWPPPPQRLAWAVRVTRRNARLCYANLIAQAALLGVSLAALADSRDFVPPWLAIVVAVGGIGLLAWTLLRAAGTRDGVEAVIGTPPGGVS
jgi:hypothetical protein